MSTPMVEGCNLSHMQRYLNEVTEFLAEYSWIYDVKNTDIFVYGVLEKIPHQWKEPLQNLAFDDLRRVPFNHCKEEWPASLQTFIQNANRLAEFRYNQKPRVDSTDLIVIPDFIKKNTPYKKQMEISWMTAIIGKLLQKHGSHTILDVGSGLGYLDQLIHHNFGVTTIGFECVTERCATANQRLIQGSCTDHMFHINSKIKDTPDCLRLMRDNLQLAVNNDCSCGSLPEETKSETKNAMMVGLHSCGDLMPDMMKLFLKLPEAKLFICASCCYHQLTLKDFPMSNGGKAALQRTQESFPGWSPSATGLRLGCQTTRAYWEKMTEEKYYHRAQCLFYRAALESFLVKEKILWHRPKKHVVRRRDMMSLESFTSYVFRNLPWSGLVKKEKVQIFEQLCLENEHLLPSIKIYNLLQTLLQPLWEGFLLADRAAYFLEQSTYCELYAMCDELVSPRNILLVATKNTTPVVC